MRKYKLGDIATVEISGVDKCVFRSIATQGFQS